MSTTSPLSLAKPLLCALFLESILYGCYVITFACTAEVLLSTRGKLKNIREVNTPVAIGTMGLFLIVSGNAALCFYRSLRVFIFSPFDMSQPGLDLILERLNIIETSFVLFGTIVGNWMLIHRCWILWNKAWKWIAIPFILWIGCIASTIVTIAIEVSSRGESVLSPRVFPSATSFWLASILINISTTGLTVLRLWLIEKANKESGLQPLQSDELPRSTLHFIICITVETGLLFTLSAIATFATYAIRSNAFFVMTAIELPIVGSACNLIILRGNRRRKQLLKLKLKQMAGNGSNLSRLGMRETGSGLARSVERTMELGASHTTTTDLSTRVWDQTQPNDRIEEIPYP